MLDPGVADQRIQAAELGYHRADQLVGLRPSRRTIAAPIPRLPPVIRTRLPPRLMLMSSRYLCSLCLLSGYEQSLAARPPIDARTSQVSLLL